MQVARRGSLSAASSTLLRAERAVSSVALLGLLIVSRVWSTLAFRLSAVLSMPCCAEADAPLVVSLVVLFGFLMAFSPWGPPNLMLSATLSTLA